MIPTLYYCYDAYCGWCYGFSPVISKLYEQWKDRLAFDVLSGGMILSKAPPHIGIIAPYILNAYQQVETTAGVKFGEEYLWHIRHPEQSDWYPDSLKPAIALSVFKKYYPDRAVEWAADLQYALHFEGRDLCDDAAYLHLVEKYDLPTDQFYELLRSEEFLEMANYEFALVKQLQVSGYPAVFLQVTDAKFYMVAHGYTAYEQLENNIKKVLLEFASKQAVL